MTPTQEHITWACSFEPKPSWKALRRFVASPDERLRLHIGDGVAVVLCFSP